MTMSVDALRLRIDTPTGELFPGRGFYQLEEDSLYVQISPFSKKYRFFSYLESDWVRLDLDKEGRLLFIEVAYARRHWRVDNRIKPPVRAVPADVRWLDFRQHMADPELLTTQGHTSLLLRFLKKRPVRSYLLAQTVVADVTHESTLAAIWVCDIIDDVAGHKIAEFRKRSRQPQEA